MIISNHEIGKNYVLDTTPLIRRDISKISIIDQFIDISKCTKKSYSITYIQSLIDMMIRYVEIYDCTFSYDRNHIYQH